MSKLKVGDICTVKKGCEGKCGSFNHGRNGKTYIKLTGLDDAGYTTYDILDNEFVKVSSCSSCFREGDLELLKNKINIMTNIKTFVKNLMLTADEKALRDAGLKTDCGDYTQDAIDVVIQDLCASNEARLVEIANKIVAENKETK